jgi:hypothetical protein
MGRSFLDNASYDPDTLKLLGQAFDEVWQEIAANYVAAPVVEDRRNRLSLVILSLAEGGERDPALIKQIALRLMKSMEAPLRRNGGTPRASDMH